MVVMTNFLLLIGAGLFSKAIWAFQENAFNNLCVPLPSTRSALYRILTGATLTLTLKGSARTSTTQAATALQTTPGAEADKFGKALASYASAWEKIADARVEQDAAIRDRFLLPWQTTLSTSIAVAMKARQAVRVSRLELDAAKQT